MKTRVRHKWVVVLLASTTLMTLVGLTTSAEFSAETTIDQLRQKQKVKLYIKGQKMREEMVDVFGQKQILITGPGKGQTYTLYPETKTYAALPPAAQSPIGQDEEALKKIGGRRRIRQEDLNGYLCDKYEIVFHNKYRGRMIVGSPANSTTLSK